MSNMTTQEQALEMAKKTLRQINGWIGFPDTGERWPNGQPMSYGACYGSNGERDYMRSIARDALAAIANVTPEPLADVTCTPPVDDVVKDADRYLNEDDFADLFRFNECAEDSDSGGHDVPKDRMKRLERLGVIRNCGFGRHEITAFGNYVIETVFYQSPKLPLKTTEEYNAAMQAKEPK